MNPGTLDDPLETCLQRLMHGIELEEVLAEFPEQAVELRPLLLAALEARRLGTGLLIPPAAQNRSLARFQAAAAGGVPRQKVSSRSLVYLRLAMAGLIGIAIMAAILLGTGLASAAALPGDVLYPVKLIVEQIQINWVQDPPARLKMEENFDIRRLNEAIQLSRIQRKQPVSFGGLLVLTEKGQWQVGDLILSFPPNFPPPDILIGTFVQVKGLSDDDVVEIQELSPRQYQWSGILQSLDFKTWMVGDIRISLDDHTQVTGATPQLGAPVNVTAIRLADKLFQAVSLEVGIGPTHTLSATRLPGFLPSPTPSIHSETGESGDSN